MFIVLRQGRSYLNDSKYSLNYNTLINSGVIGLHYCWTASLYQRSIFSQLQLHTTTLKICILHFRFMFHKALRKFKTFIFYRCCLILFHTSVFCYLNYIIWHSCINLSCRNDLVTLSHVFFWYTVQSEHFTRPLSVLCYSLMPPCSWIHLHNDLEWHSENRPFFRPFALTFNL